MSLNSTAPAKDGVEITPNDSADLSTQVRALVATVAGTCKVTTVGGTDLTIQLAAGSAMPLVVRRVWSTGTTATGIVGLI